MKLRYSFIDPIFGRESQARFQVSKVYIYGNWFGETWEDKERQEYWIRLKGFYDNHIELVFPTSEARNKAIANIVPDRNLEKPINDPLIERIDENYIKPFSKEISTKTKVGVAAGIGIIAGLFGFVMMRGKKHGKSTRSKSA